MLLATIIAAIICIIVTDSCSSTYVIQQTVDKEVTMR